jgi:hypothetical protein
MLAAFTVGCENESMLEGECAARFVWRGVEYDGVGPDPHVHPRGEDVLGRGGIRGCENKMEVPGDVVSLDGVDPRVAVGLEPDDSQAGFSVFGRPGYLIDSAAHPAHRFVWDDPARPRWRIGYRCGEPTRMSVVAISTPRGWFASFRVRGVRARDRRSLRAGRTRRVRIPGDVRVSGLSRHGAPYVAAGDRLTLDVRACQGLERREPAGYYRIGRALIADAIDGRAD